MSLQVGVSYPLIFAAKDGASPAERSLALREFRLARLLALLKLLGPWADDILELLAGINVAELPGFLQAVRDVWNAPGAWSDPAALKNRVLLTLYLAKSWTKLTPGDRDNELLDAVDRWQTANPAVLDFIVELVARGLALILPADADGRISMQALESLVTEEDRAKFTAQAIDWALVFQIVKFLIDVFRQVRPAPSPA